MISQGWHSLLVFDRPPKHSCPPMPSDCQALSFAPLALYCRRLCQSTRERLPVHAFTLCRLRLKTWPPATAMCRARLLLVREQRPLLAVMVVFFHGRGSRSQVFLPTHVLSLHAHVVRSCGHLFRLVPQHLRTHACPCVHLPPPALEDMAARARHV